jgi:hypothetical protein
MAAEVRFVSLKIPAAPAQRGDYFFALIAAWIPATLRRISQKLESNGHSLTSLTAPQGQIIGSGP